MQKLTNARFVSKEDTLKTKVHVNAFEETTCNKLVIDGTIQPAKAPDRKERRQGS